MFVDLPFQSDGGLYVYMGKVVAEGGVLYRDFYENKPPGVALVTALCWRLFHTHWVAYVAMQWALTIIASALLARTVARHVGSHAWRPTFLCAVLLLNFSPVVFTGFQLETLVAFFAIIGACAAIESIVSGSLADSMLLGLAAGCASMIKPTGLAVLGAWVLTLLVLCGRRRMRLGRAMAHVAIALLAAAIPNAGVAAWVIRSDLWPDMPALFEQIRLYGSETPLDDLLPVRLAAVVVFLGFPLFVRGWIYRRHRLSKAVHTVSTGLLCFAVTWLVLEALAVFLQGRMYLYHFLVIFPPAAILFGLLPRFDRDLPIIMALGPWVLASLAWSLPTALRSPHGLHPRPSSEYVRARTAPGDAIYADQTPRYLLETDRRPGSRIGTLFYFVNYDQAPLDYCRILLDDFEARRPKYILLASDLDELLEAQEHLPLLTDRPTRLRNFRTAWAQIRRYMSEHYVFEAWVGDDLVYRRVPDGRAVRTSTAVSEPATRPGSASPATLSQARLTP
jgi:hypothetical protein